MKPFAGVVAVVVVLLPGAHCWAQEKPSPWTDVEKPIFEKLRTLRKVPDDKRGNITKKLAIEIRHLTSPGQLNLAAGLAGLATEGDYGKGPLQEVAVTLAQAVKRNPPPPDKSGAPAGPYVQLAELIRYEHVKVSLDDPQLKAAFAKLDENDKLRQNANFTLNDLNGKSWTLKDLRGSVVLVNFWATWCPPCRKEMPDLDALHRRFHKQGLVILSMSSEEEAKVRSFLADKHYEYSILLDPGEKVNQAFAIEGIPKSFLYDREGKLVAQAIDMRTMNQFLGMLREAGLK
jgi:peroxiredoxin